MTRHDLRVKKGTERSIFDVIDGLVRLREGAPEEDVIIHFDGVTKAFGKDVVLQASISPSDEAV